MVFGHATEPGLLEPKLCLITRNGCSTLDLMYTVVVSPKFSSLRSGVSGITAAYPGFRKVVTPSRQQTRELEDIINASLQRGRQG